MAVRLRDVADRAGVSVRTVSNVVNDFAHVAPQTRSRVQQAIDELGYRPNANARQLRLGRTETISLVVPEIDSPYFAELASLVVRDATERGWTVHIDQTDGDPVREQRLVAGPDRRTVDGVVLSPWTVSPEELARLGSTPLVLLGERRAVGTVDHVAVDNVAASREATAHLLATGRRRIGVVGLQPQLVNDTARLREQGFRAAMGEAGVPVDDRLLARVDRLHRPDGAAAAARLLDAATPPDAVFCFSDQLALGVLRTLADRGVRVPEDVAVVGFDDIEDGRFAVPSLSTVSPDKPAIARLALDCLADRLADPQRPGRDLVAGHRLTPRESSGSRSTL